MRSKPGASKVNRTDLSGMSSALSGAVVARLGQASHALRSRPAAALMLPAFVVGPPHASRRPKMQPTAGSLRAFRNVGGSGDKTARGESSPVKDKAIAAAIEQERAARDAAKPEKLGRSLTETLRDHRDELFNLMLAALLCVLTLKMLREKGEKLDEESESTKQVKVLEAQLADLEASIVDRVRSELPNVRGFGWGARRPEVEKQILQLVLDGLASAKDRQGSFERAQLVAAPDAPSAESLTATVGSSQSAVKKGLV